LGESRWWNTGQKQRTARRNPAPPKSELRVDEENMGQGYVLIDPKQRKRRWLRWTTAVCTVMGVGIIAAFKWDDGLRALTYHVPLRYDEPFGPAIAAADRIVVRGDGFDYCVPIDETNILFVVTNQVEVAAVAGHMRFLAITTSNALSETCMCSGGPGIDWYQGQRRLALTSMQHGKAIRWRGFSTMRILGLHVRYGDGPLTPDAREWLIHWLAKKGVPWPLEEIEAGKRRVALAKEARAILQPFVPKPFVDAIQNAQLKARENWAKGEDVPFELAYKLKDQFIRDSFVDAPGMYASLFRIMGCLPSCWDRRYREQDEAYGFLVRAPRQELDSAFRAAATSKDQVERSGAARIIFTQYAMRQNGKTDQDLAGWMGLLAETAYGDPFPENRRVVLTRLKEHPQVDALSVLRQAVEDADVVVRRIAIEALAASQTSAGRELLQQIASGGTRPRLEPQEKPKNYGAGTGTTYGLPGMESLVYSNTDAEAAARILSR